MTVRRGTSRRLAAVWFADIVGYTRVSARDESVALDLVGILQQISERTVEARSGRVVKFIGDAVMTEFRGCEDAVLAALDLIDDFGTRAADTGHDAALRVGVHLGELTAADDGDIYGDVVNTAARLQGEADPGDVVVSEDVWRQLARRPSLDFDEVGARTLKGKDEPVRAFVVSRKFAHRSEGMSFVEEPSDGRRRLVVLPFEVPQADDEVDFLAFGLPDAISSSLMSLNSLVVRSPLRHAPEQQGVDAREAARAAAADLVLSGLVQRAGDRVRVTVRLSDGSDGTLLWNAASTSPLGDLFEVQDDVTRRIVDSLTEPLTTEERASVTRDVPASGKAYSLYLRANEAAVHGRDWARGVELYREAVAEDPSFAPAWARLGRCLRLLGKYAPDQGESRRWRAEAEAAFERALELNPELPLTHGLYAQLEVEAGRPVEGLVRLLRSARRHRSDVDLFVGLTHALRYAGLCTASLAAHERAVQLDPAVRTSVAYTHLQIGDFEGALDSSPPRDPSRLYALQSLGRPEEVRARHESEDGDSLGMLAAFGDTVLATLDGDVAGALEHGERAIDGFPDPEGRYFIARCWASLGLRDAALEVLRRVVEDGFCCGDGLRSDPLFQTLRANPALGELHERCDARREAAAAAFLQEGGARVVGVTEAELGLA